MNRSGWLFLTVVSILLTIGSCPTLAPAEGLHGAAGPVQDSPQALLPKCQSALSACDVLQKDQDEQIKALQAQTTEWKHQAAANSLTGSSITLYTALGGAAGGLAVGEVNGKSGLVGGAIGAAIGAIIGLAIGGLTQ